MGTTSITPGSPGMHLGMGVAAGAAACVSGGMQQVQSGIHTCSPSMLQCGDSTCCSPLLYSQCGACLHASDNKQGTVVDLSSVSSNAIWVQVQ